MQQKAFEDMKNELCANTIVQSYGLQKKEQLILKPLKKQSAGFFRKKDIQLYMYKKMTPVEENYSNIERKELEIVFVVTRLKQFLLGRRYTLKTHYKSLKYLFAPNDEIPKML